MSSFINIPSSSQLPIRPAATSHSTEQQARQPYSSSQDTTQGYYRFTHTSSVYSSSVASSNGSAVPYHGDAQPLNADKGKGKARMESVSSNAGPSVRRPSNDVAMLCRDLPPAWAQGHGRRSSLMSDSFLDVEHRVVDVGCNGRMNLVGSDNDFSCPYCMTDIARLHA